MAVSIFGGDFHRARRNWLYDGVNGQPLWLALLIVVLLVILNGALQLAFALALAPLMEGGAGDPKSFVKATILGILPTALLVSATCYAFAGVYGGNAKSATALHWPDLSILGWLTVVGGFLVAIYAIVIGVVLVTGVDLSNYTPGPNGQSPDSGSAGMVKEAMFDLANEPRLFWLAFPSVAFGAPIVEEFLFRGPAFAALAQSRLGRAGTVVVTSLAWSLLHISEPWLSVALIFLMGLVLGALLLRFGSLWITIACHGAWNGVFTVLVWGFAPQ